MSDGMREVFLTILRMSFVAGYVILVVLFVRRLLRRFPKRYSYLLWSVVFFRLVCPFGTNSPVSLIPERLISGADGQKKSASENSGDTEIYDEADTDMDTGTKTDTDYRTKPGGAGKKEAIPGQGNGAPDGNPEKGSAGTHGGSSGNSSAAAVPDKPDAADMPDGAERPGGGQNQTNTAGGIGTGDGSAPFHVLSVLCAVWAAGVLVFWIVWAHSLRKFRKRLVGAVRAKDGVFESEQVAASFVDGIFRPVIYLAPGLSGPARQYVLCHEQVHVRRRDPLVKAAALFLVSIYWFHPLVWLAFGRMCEDMEMSCDERVVERMGAEIKKEYSGTLLQMAQRTNGLGLLTAFGENEVKSRVKNILSYRKPKTWLAVLLLVIVAAVGIGLSTDPGTADAEVSGGSKIRQNEITTGKANKQGADGKTEPDGGEENQPGQSGTAKPDGGGGNQPGQSGTAEPDSGGDGKTPGSGNNLPSEETALKYAKLLSRYRTALEEEWSAEQLTEAGLSTLARYCYEGGALNNVGWVLLDLDGDGRMELLIGASAGDPFVNRQIFELYVLEDGEPVQVFAGRERSRYYLCREENGSYTLVNECSSGAANSEWHYYSLRGRELAVVRTILFDGRDGEYPWQAADGGNAEEGRLTEVTEEAAHAAIEAYEAKYMLPDYIPFAALDGLFAGDGGGTNTKWKVSGKNLENQLNLIISRREEWEQREGDPFFGDARYTVVDLNHNGRLELIVSACQGTGIYTYTKVYEVSEDGNSLLHYEHNVPEGDSQADIITGSAPYYYDPAADRYWYVFEDLIRDGAAQRYESIKSWELRDGRIVENCLAFRNTEYVNRVPQVTYGGSVDGVPIMIREEYESAADRTFRGLQKGRAYFLWISGPDGSLSDDTAKQKWYQELWKVYKSFSAVPEGVLPDAGVDSES